LLALPALGPVLLGCRADTENIAPLQSDRSSIAGRRGWAGVRFAVAWGWGNACLPAMSVSAWETPRPGLMPGPRRGKLGQTGHPGRTAMGLVQKMVQNWA